MDQFFHEHEGVGNIQRMTYLSDLEQFIEKKQKDSEMTRDAYMESFHGDQEAMRQAYYRMLGWPLTEYRAGENPPAISYTYLGKDEQAEIYRLTLEVLPSVRFGGVLFKLPGDVKAPLVLSQHGGKGTPEIISGLYDDGNTWNYNQMTRRVLKRGVHVFAPQLLLWDQEKYHVHYDRALIDRKLKQLGGSITALEIYAIMKCIDALSKEAYVDENRIGMVGLSYGGFYTLFTTAADVRIKSAIASGCFDNRLLIPWCDWTWKDCANTFLDAEVGALVAPRGLKLQMGLQDEIFPLEPCRQEYARLKVYYEKAGCADKLQMEFFQGHHEFSLSDETIDSFMQDLLS